MEKLTNPELCPFCGNECKAYEWTSPAKQVDALWSVRCDNCDAHSRGYLTADEAIAAWNLRTFPQRKPNEVSIQCTIPTDENAAALLYGLLDTFVDEARKFPEHLKQVEFDVVKKTLNVLISLLDDSLIYFHQVSVPGKRTQYASVSRDDVPEDISELQARQAAKPNGKFEHTVCDALILPWTIRSHD